MEIVHWVQSINDLIHLMLNEDPTIEQDQLVSNLLTSFLDRFQPHQKLAHLPKAPQRPCSSLVWQRRPLLTIRLQVSGFDHLTIGTGVWQPGKSNTRMAASRVIVESIAEVAATAVATNAAQNTKQRSIAGGKKVGQRAAMIPRFKPIE